MILLALLAVLGIPIWLVVGVLIAVWQIRRAVKQQPGVFEILVRAEDTDKWPRELSYGRVVRDVLVDKQEVADADQRPWSASRASSPPATLDYPVAAKPGVRVRRLARAARPPASGPCRA